MTEMRDMEVFVFGIRYRGGNHHVFMNEADTYDSV